MAFDVIILQLQDIDYNMRSFSSPQVKISARFEETVVEHYPGGSSTGTIVHGTAEFIVILDNLENLSVIEYRNAAIEKVKVLLPAFDNIQVY